MNNPVRDITSPDEEIAIIAMSGRFPGAGNIAQFWENLRNGVESVSFFSEEELRASGVDPALLSHPGYVRAGGVLPDIESFDARFFGFSPREAELLDPQHRLFLECAWEALETAGYDSQHYAGLIGVYAGQGISRYLLYNLLSNRDTIDEFQARLATDKDFAPTRVSYKLNLKGPSVSIQTACSTSLVAVHMACQSLLNGECDMALAGGVSIKVPQKIGYLYQEGGIVSADGHCRAFDARSEGFVPGSGAGIVLLKRLSDALRDGDGIEAVIKGSAINNDGGLKVGYTAPSVEGQSEVIAEALAMAGLDAETVTYVEAHGTGTALGDPIEIKALARAFETHTQKKGFCGIGSVKTNIGHLDTAAGVAGLIKTVLSLKNRMIPASLHFERPNPEIGLENTPFYVNSALTQWQSSGHPRRAGVSSFGVGGTNAHVILEESPALEASPRSDLQQLLVLSAKTETALETCTTNLIAHLKQNPESNLADTAYTLRQGRRTFNHRKMVVCHDLADALKALETNDPQRVLTSEQESGKRPVAFMFPGGGAQYLNMGLELYRVEPVFQKVVDECAELLEPRLGFDLREYLYPKPHRAEEIAEQLNRTSIALPALFVVEYALARLWMSWGIQPEAMIGHSLGEYVAACLAGVFSLPDALSLVVVRGELFEKLPRGAMLSVLLPEADVLSLFDGKLSVAAVNSPSQCVVSAPVEVIEEAANVLTARGVEHRRLHIEVAAHSTMVTDILVPFEEFVTKLRFGAPRIPFVSNVTGTWITTGEATDPGYWVRHLRQTVRFDEGLRQLLAHPERILLEVGPSHTLSTVARQNPEKKPQHAVLTSMRHPKDRQSDRAFLLNALGKLWLEGVEVNWSGFQGAEQRRRVQLPTYPFERQRYWIEPQERAHTEATRQSSMSKKPDAADWFYVPVWRESAPPLLAELEGHRKQRNTWLVFTDRYGLGTRLAELLREGGHKVVTVVTGEHFGSNDEGDYTVNPRRRDDYEALLAELQTSGEIPDRVLHLWTLTRNDELVPEIDRVEGAQELGFYSLFFLAQALGEQVFAPTLGTQALLRALRITVLTNGLHEVTGRESLRPEKATVIGPCRVIPQEYPNVTCSSVDIVMPENGHEEKLVRQILCELFHPHSDSLIAYRGRHRWVQSYEPVRLSDAPSATRLREHGVYLITGGLGGIGLELAHYLAESVRAKLILVTHSVFPPRDDWQEWLATHDEDDRTSLRIRKLLAIESLGAEIMIGVADISDARQLETLISQAHERFGFFNGVIHSAGVRPEGIIQQKEAAEAATLLAPKVRGTLLLSALLDSQELDFFVLCSSMRAIVGGAGMVDHTAANAFLDAFALSRISRGDPIISINWDSWGEVGQSVEPTLRPATEPRIKARMLSIEGVDVFRRSLASTLPQVINSIQDIQAAIDYYQGGDQRMDIEELLNAAPARAAHSRPRLRTAFVAPRDEVEEALAGIWQELLGIERVGIHDNFFELGGDSVIGIRIIARCNQRGLRLTPRKVFEHQTIAELAAVAEKVQVAEVERGPVIGPVPLTPVQHWFFERQPQRPHRFALAVLLEFLAEVDSAYLERAVQEVLIHHDALRLRFFREGDEWRQYNTAPAQVIPLQRFELASLSATEQQAAIEEAATRLSDELNLAEGQLIRFGLFDLGPQTPGRLLVVINHLAIDVRSWRILLEDLQSAYQQLSRGEAVKLPAKTTSFRQWAMKLAEHAQTRILEQELAYWTSEPRTHINPLPVDFPGGINDEASARRISVWLGEEETRELLNEVPRAYQVEIDDVLLTALTQTFARWSGHDTHLFDLENDGRELLFAEVDLSRTIGWFTTLTPVRLDIERTASPEEALKSVKEQLRSVPNQGIGYGLLRYLKDDVETRERLRNLPQAEVNYLYLGRIAQGLSDSSVLKASENFKGQESDIGGTRSHLLHVTGSVIDGRLRMDWTYGQNLHRHDTIRGLAEHFLVALRSLITHCLASEAGGYTPSDFPDVNLSQEDLDDIITRAIDLSK